MKTLKLTLAFALLSAAALPCAAQQGRAGGDAFDFLFLDEGARPTAMGGAYTALATDANALYYNPAGLGRIAQHEATFMHNQYFGGVNHEYVGLATRQGFGTNLNYVGYGQIDRTTISSPNGTLGTFGANDLAVGLGYGHNFYDTLSLGVGAKYISENIDKVAADGYAFDAGLLYPIAVIPRLTLGIVGQNLGPSVRFSQNQERMPTNVRAGLAYGMTIGDTENTISADIMKERSQGYLFAVGAETIYNKTIALRAGFNLRNTAGLGITAGLGWNVGAFSIDYAIVPYGDLGLTNSISATVRWGAKPPQEYRENRDKPKIKRADENTPEAHFALAEEHRKAGYYLLAKKELQLGADMLNENDQRMVYYYEEMGYIAWLKKDVPQAHEYYSDGLKLAMSLGLNEPVVADAYTGLGMCLLREGNPAYAKQVFEKALEAHPREKTRRYVERELETLRGAKSR